MRQWEMLLSSQTSVLMQLEKWPDRKIILWRVPWMAAVMVFLTILLCDERNYQ